MNEEALRLAQAEVERLCASPPPPLRPTERLTIHHTQLPDPLPGSPSAAAWNLYRRTVGRLLTEGQEGRWVLIHAEEIVGIWDTQAEADAVRRERFPARPVLLKQILSQEPVLRIGYNHVCRS